MNRKRGVLLLALVVAGGTSATARGDVAAANGQLLDFVNYSAEPQWQASFVNAAMCSGQATLQLEWNLGQTPMRTGIFQLYASNRPPAFTGGSTILLCPTLDDANASPPGFAGPIGSGVQVTAVAQSTQVTGAGAVEAAGIGCDTASEMRVFYICAHVYEGATPTLSASGKFVVQTLAPAPPTDVRVVPAVGALDVSWTSPSAGSTAPPDHFVAFASPRGSSGTRVASAEVRGTSVRLSGLLAEQEYDVTVVAYSIGGNPSAPSPAVVATPDPPNGVVEPIAPVLLVRSHGGGCGTGGAGAVSLAALAALARVRRQRR